MSKFRACCTSFVTRKKLHKLEQLSEIPFSCHRPHTGWYVPSNTESEQKKAIGWNAVLLAQQKWTTLPFCYDMKHWTQRKP